MVNLDRCVGSCNTLNDLSNKVSVPNETEDFYRKKKFKILKKDISCDCNCKFDGRKSNSNQSEIMI